MKKATKEEHWDVENKWKKKVMKTTTYKVADDIRKLEEINKSKQLQYTMVEWDWREGGEMEDLGNDGKMTRRKLFMTLFLILRFNVKKIYNET